MADYGAHPKTGKAESHWDDTATSTFGLRQVGHLLRRTYAIARGNSAAALSVLGDVSPVQASVLGALSHGALNQAELGRRIGMEPANTHTIIKRMVAAGLVDIGRDPENRRVVLAALTLEGARIAGRLEGCIEIATQQTLAALTLDERKALVAMLGRIVLADSEKPDSSPKRGSE